MARGHCDLNYRKTEGQKTGRDQATVKITELDRMTYEFFPQNRNLLTLFLNKGDFTLL